MKIRRNAIDPNATDLGAIDDGFVFAVPRTGSQEEEASSLHGFMPWWDLLGSARCFLARLIARSFRAERAS